MVLDRLRVIMKNKIDYILSLLKNKNEFHDSIKKVVFHKENFRNSLKGEYFKIDPIIIDIVPSLECNQNCSRCTYKQNKSKDKSGNNRLMKAIWNERSKYKI